MKTLTNSPVINLSSCFSGNNDLLYPFNKKKVIFFGYGRTALLNGLKILNINSEHNVLLPSYICNVLLSPFTHLGVKIKYYDVNENLEPDLHHMEKLIDAKTKAVLAINYFGFPTKIDEITQLCKKNGIFFIEDNAHGFLSKLKNRALGTFGDISIFSIRKTLPVLNGAALSINNEAIPVKNHFKEDLNPENNDFIFLLRQLNKKIDIKLGTNPMKIIKGIFGKKYVYCSKEESKEEERNIKKYFTKQSGLTSFMLKCINIERLSKIRQEAFKYWLINLQEGEPFYKELPEGVVPYVFPVKIKDRERFIKGMLKKGVEAFTWPTLPSDLTSYPDFYKQTAAIPLWMKYEIRNN